MNSVQLPAADIRALLGQRPSLQLMIGGLVFVILISPGIGAVMAWALIMAEVVGDPGVTNQISVRPPIDSPGSHRCTVCGIVKMIVTTPTR